MIDIQWKGKVGYGDIVSPICYAHNLSYKLGQRVDLTFRWDGTPQDKINPRDPETLWERANYINSLCEKDRTEVNIIHRFNNPLDINHTNYDWDVVGKDIYHNYWVPKQQNRYNVDRNLIVVNSTEGNALTLNQYGKSWKDPIAKDWLFVVVTLKSLGYEVEVVDYRTPIRRLCSFLKEAKGFVGYHGTAAWVARFMHTPSIIFSRGGSLTTNAFFTARIHTELVSPPTNFFNTLDAQLAHARVDIAQARDKYFRQYIPGIKFLRSLDYHV